MFLVDAVVRTVAFAPGDRLAAGSRGRPAWSELPICEPPDRQLDSASSTGARPAGGAPRPPCHVHDQDHAQLPAVASSTSYTTVRGVRRSLLAFRSVMSTISSFVVRGFSTNSRPALRAAACGGRPRPADPIPLRSQGRDVTLPACLTVPTALRSGPSTLTPRGAQPCTLSRFLPTPQAGALDKARTAMIRAAFLL